MAAEVSLKDLQTATATTLSCQRSPPPLSTPYSQPSLHKACMCVFERLRAIVTNRSPIDPGKTLPRRLSYE